MILRVITGRDQNNTRGNRKAELVFKRSFSKNEDLGINARNLEGNQQACITSECNNRQMGLNFGSILQKEILKRLK